MSVALDIPYSSRASALRGAKRSGLDADEYTIAQDEKGKFRIVERLPDARAVPVIGEQAAITHTVACPSVPEPAPKATTKKAIVLSMLKAGGATVAEISARLKIGPGAAASLVNDLLAIDVAITSSRIEGSRQVRYTA